MSPVCLPRRRIALMATSFAILACAWTATWAQNENETVGFQSNHIFESGAFGENLDVLNGGLNLSAPIGQRFQVNSRLSYGLGLSYNSKVWDSSNYSNNQVAINDRVAPFNEGPLGIGFNLNLGRILIEPRLMSPCDLGDYSSCWTKSYVWVAPDGSQHEFYHDDALRAVGWDSQGVGSPQLFNRRMTTDGSLTLISGPSDEYCYPSNNSGCYRVETPDGLVYSLAKRVDCLDPSPTSTTIIQPQPQSENHSYCGWYTTLIEDPTVGSRSMTGTSPYKVLTPFPNHVKVTYDSRAGFEHAISQVEDSTGRVIAFDNCEWEEGANQALASGSITSKCKATPSNPANRHAVVTRSIDLPSFGNSSALVDPTPPVSPPDPSTVKRMKYTFFYELNWIRRAHMEHEAACAPPATTGCAAWPVAKLVRIDYPDIMKPTGPPDQFSMYFGYSNNAPRRCAGANPTLCSSDLDCGGAANSCQTSASNGDYGEVSCRTLPVPRMTGNACGVAGVSAGVARYLYSSDYYVYAGTYMSGGRGPRKVPCNTGYNAVGTICIESGGNGGFAPTGFTRQVVYKTLEQPAGTAAGTWTYDRGVSTSSTNPTEVVVTDPVGNDTVYHYYGSQSSHDNANSGSGPEDGYAPEWRDGSNYRVDYHQGRRTNGVLVRSEATEFDADPYPGDISQHSKSNTRPKQSRTEYIDDAAQALVTTRTDWDGIVGRWRNEVVSGFGITAPKTTRSLWRGGLTYSSGTIYNPAPLMVEVSDGTRVLARTDNSYDSVGRLAQSVERAVLPGSIGTPPSMTAYAGDRVTAYTYSAASGNITQKTISSGTSSYTISYGWVPSGGTCLVAGECGGYLATKAFLNGASAPWKAIDRSRDGNTGLIYQVRDSAGVMTAYEYDPIGRVTAIRPTGEDPTLVDYVSLLETTVTQGNPAGNDFIFSRHRYDTLGRLISTQKRPADASQYACQKKEYDILGRVLYETEWALGSPTGCLAPINHATEKGTTYIYTDPVSGKVDPFGRVRKVIPAEDDPGAGDKSTTTDYFGTSSQVMVHGVRGATGAAFNATTVFYRDALGRLQGVDSPPGGADAEYTYDALDRLLTVDLMDELGGATKHQLRRFGFDGLGRQTWSENPENGTVSILAFDALDNPLQIQDAAGNVQRFEYDYAGRLRFKHVTPTGSTERTVLERVFDQPDTGWSLGKVTTLRSRDEEGIQILEERLTYSGLGGRLSEQWHQFSDWPGGVQEHSTYYYNSRGQLSGIDYPREPSATRSPLSIGYEYANGSVVRAIEGGTGITLGRVYYNAAGGIKRLETPGGGRSEILFDSLNRPTRITAGQYGTSDWLRPPDYDSGAFVYDGAGNIYQIGDNRYGYDGSGRLVSAHTKFDASAIYDESFVYDVFGNITHRQLSSTIPGTATEFEDFLFSTQAPFTNQIVNHQTTYGSTNATPVTFVYDANGNQIVGGRRVQVPGAPLVTDLKRYDYDALNRVTRIHQSSGPGAGETLTQIGRYGYDLNGNRISKVEFSAGLKTYYVRDQAGQVLTEFRTPTGGTQAPEWESDYVYLGGRLISMKENLKPDPPKGLRGQSAPSGSGHRITLTWDENTESDRSSYRVYRKREGIDTNFGSIAQVPVGANATISVEDPLIHTTNQVISYYIAAIDGIGYESVGSRAIKVVAGDTTRPSAPDLYLISGNGEVSLTWTASTDNSDILGYEVYRGSSPSGGADVISPLVLLTPVPVYDLQFVDQTVSNGSVYYYRVRAIDTVGNGGYYSCQPGGNPCDRIATPHDMTPPGVPKNVRAASTCGSLNQTETVDVSWDANPPRGSYGIRYDIYRNTTPSFSGLAPLTRVSTTTFHDPASLTPGQQYFYSVRAIHVVVSGATETEITNSVLSQAVAATPRDSSITPQVYLLARAREGSVDVSWQANPFVGSPSPAPTAVYYYRRPNSDRSCSAFVRVAETTGATMSTTDATVINNQAYDYAISFLVSNRESSLSRPTLAIPVAKPKNLFQCAKSGLYGQSETKNVVQWTPPMASLYQPLTVDVTAGTTGYLKGYHLYHHKQCLPAANFQTDRSPLRMVVTDSVDTVDPYLLGKDATTNLEFRDPRYGLGGGTQFSPALDSGIGPEIAYDCNGNVSQNCVMPRAVYKVFAEGTWLTVESDWPDYYHSHELNPQARCDIPFIYMLDSENLPDCGDPTADSVYIPTPRRVTAEPAGPAAIQLSWDPPLIAPGRPPLAGYYIYARPANLMNGTPLEAPAPVAFVGPGEHSLVVGGLSESALQVQSASTAPFNFRVAGVDQAGRVSAEAFRCAETGIQCNSATGCEQKFCSFSHGACSNDSQCSYGECTVSHNVCSASGTCPAFACAVAPYSNCVQVRRIGTFDSNSVDGTSFSVTVHPTAGHSLVAVIGTLGNSNSRVSSITQTGATWTRADQKTNNNGVTLEIWYANNVGASVGTQVSITLAASLKASAVIAEYAGFVTSSVVDKMKEDVGQSTTPSTGSTQNTSQASEFWIAGIANTGDAAPTQPTDSFSQVGSRAGASPAVGLSVAMYEKQAAATGNAGMSATLPDSRYWSGVVVTFKSSASEATQCGSGSCAAQSCERDLCVGEECEASGGRVCESDPSIACTISSECPGWQSEAKCNFSGTPCDPTQSGGCPTGQVCFPGDLCTNSPTWVTGYLAQETVSPGAPGSLRPVLWTVNDDIVGRGRDGIKIAWQAARKSTSASTVLGFRVYRSDTQSGPFCALLDAGTPVAPLPAGISRCSSLVGTRSVDQDAYSSEYSTGYSSPLTPVWSYWDRTVPVGKSFYYRATQLENDGTGVHETPLPESEITAGRVIPYDVNTLPPPQGFRAWAPHGGDIADQKSIALAWCAVPSDTTVAPGSDLPHLDHYNVYRTGWDDRPYRLLAKISPDCFLAGKRCEITDSQACVSTVYQTLQPSCTVISPLTTGTCGTPGAKLCGVADLTFQSLGDNVCWPSDREAAIYQARYTYRYHVTAVSQAGVESMPSLENEGWPNYCATHTLNGDGSVSGYFHCTPPATNCTFRRDPEGNGDYPVCGNEDALLLDPTDGSSPGVEGEYLYDDGLAGYRIIGLPPVCNDCQGGGGSGQNPYNPPARFVFYHLDHLGSPRVILDIGGAKVSVHHYLPFGEERPAQSDPTLNDRGFTGHQRDSETGLDYMMARYFSSSLGRFMAVDPGSNSIDKSNPQTWNRYQYVRNNPINRVDPDGQTDAQGVRAVKACMNADVQKEMASALTKAGTDNPDPGKTKEAVGGVGERMNTDGSGTGELKAYSEVKPDATFKDSPPATTADISRATGGESVLSFHTHQLAGRAVPEQYKPQNSGAINSHDLGVASTLGVPMVVVSRTEVRIAWENDAGKMETAIIMSFSSPGALAGGAVPVTMPKQLAPPPSP